MDVALSCPGCGAAATASATHCAYCQRQLSTVGCSRCYARLFPGMACCPSCGARRAEPVTREPVYACPGCATRGVTSSLHAVEIGALPLHECRACAGVWLSRETMHTLETDRAARAAFGGGSIRRTPLHVDAIASTAMPIRYRRCPSCATLMHRRNVARISGVIVDRCAAHGDFFEVDELPALVRFYDEGGVDRLRAVEREELAGERRKHALLHAIDAKRERWMVERQHPEARPSVAAWLVDALLDG
ncbi:MAG: zf-TFIIB domain-containing protein [Gemmatimonadaceae bacterium]|jgi:Zn-finger nucleic acid-binding protein|nr:zf-TFIIB domain-containing protein [Gemmatimonadaceae bacterium]